MEENNNDQTFLSVIISPRTSSIGADVPIMIIVFLMSLTMNPRLTLPLPPSQRVAKLHWLILCLANLGSKLTVLQPGALPEEKMPTPRGQESDPEDERIQALNARRETDGYIIIRHRTVTASIARGPSTPTLVPHPLREGFGEQLQLSRLSPHISSRLPGCADLVAASCSMASDAALQRVQHARQSGQGSRRLACPDAQFPDLSVKVRLSAERSKQASANDGSPTPAKAPILAQKLLRPDTIYCLLDAASPGLTHIIFTFPPYRQRACEEAAGPERMMKDGKYLFEDEFITLAVLALHLNDSILELIIGDLNKLATLPGDSRFQLSTPSKRSVLPPPLSRKSKPIQVPRCVALSRPRPPSPRLEAQLVTQHAESLRQKRVIERARKPAPPRQIIIADNPYFDFNINPVRQREFVPSNTKLPVDLIFSLRQPDPKYFNTPLIKLVIAIPFGAIQKKKPLAKSTEHMIPDETNKTKTDDLPPPFTPLLGPNPDPPMPTMLSNMRFNIIKQFGTKKEGFENHLILEVIPRAAAGVDVSLVCDASFLMSGVEIAWYEGPEVLEPKS
ncbi:Tol [Fusarium coicis]|nr:Tol [Fusarium coicis]